MTKSLRTNSDIFILSGDKDTSVEVLDKNDYQQIVQNMVDQDMEEGKYFRSDDTTIKDLSSFQGFLHRHFKDHPEYQNMRPSSNQPAQFFATAKTYKFDNPNEVNLPELKLRPIIDQTGTCYYAASKVIASYLSPLAKNEFVIKDTQKFPSMLQNLPPLFADEENVSYDIDSLFTSVPVKETVEYICHQIYDKHDLKPVSRPTFKKLFTN
ncbi:uncharacterized protein LOC130657781 [Hydractinia symbiolongicarpus]|uniref:uncharacterized protein LOC130657781 n=1 Tax=Hydractinia symbiolongicarpus TaxID=13093 RepID=UPI002550AFB8|nr:uncharacterized protein LOC130657781 [Hydractinia symbiolongicarpus]